MGLGITLLSVDEVRELGRVADEEDRGVVEHPVEVALLRPELDSEPCHATVFSAGTAIQRPVDIPRGSRAVSAEPDSPPTVEKRIVVLALFPTLLKRAAQVKSEMSSVTSK